MVALPDGSPQSRGLARAAMSLDTFETNRILRDTSILVEDGTIVLHAHVAGKRAHLWVYDVDGIDGLDRAMAGDPMAPFMSGDPQIVALVSLERMREREQGQ